MADKLSVVALREVGSTPGVADTVVTKLLDRYAGAMSKEAERRARATLLAEAGARTIADFSQLERLTAERDARPTPEAHAYAKKAARNMGALMGMAAGATLTVLVGSALIAIGSRSTVEGAAVGSMIRAQSDNTQTLEDIETGEHGRIPLPETP